MIYAVLKNYRQSPRKVRLVTDSIKGKKTNAAIMQLSFISKRASLPLIKLINSAVANAKENHQIEAGDLFIKSITVDEGYTIKRHRARARGSASAINKRTSHVKVILDSHASPKKALKKEASHDKVKKVAKKAVKKAAIKKNPASPKKVSTKKATQDKGKVTTKKK